MHLPRAASQKSEPFNLHVSPTGWALCGHEAPAGHGGTEDPADADQDDADEADGVREGDGKTVGDSTASTADKGNGDDEEPGAVAAADDGDTKRLKMDPTEGCQENRHDGIPESALPEAGQERVTNQQYPAW